MASMAHASCPTRSSGRLPIARHSSISSPGAAIAGPALREMQTRSMQPSSSLDAYQACEIRTKPGARLICSNQRELRDAAAASAWGNTGPSSSLLAINYSGRFCCKSLGVRTRFNAQSGGRFARVPRTFVPIGGSFPDIDEVKRFWPAPGMICPGVSIAPHAYEMRPLPWRSLVSKQMRSLLGKEEKESISVDCC